MSIEMTTLSNGLRVVTDHNAKVETAAIGLWVPVGARHETIRTNGIAHMLEHMAFKGTKTRSAKDIAQQIEQVGGYLNAATSRETTSYYARVLKDDVGLSLDILGDILQNSVFDEDELAKERDVILQEINQTYDTPDDIVFDYFQEAAFPNQSVGRSILGTDITVKSFQKSDLQKFMHEHYCADSIVLSVSGNVDHDAIAGQAEKILNGFAPRSDYNFEKAEYQGGIKKVSRDLEQVHLLFGHEGLPIGHKDYYVVAVLSSILGGGMSSRLFQEVREKRGLVYSIYSFHSSFSDSGLFGIYAGASPEQASALTPVVHEEIRKVCDSVEDEELDRSKAQLKASVMMGLESTMARCEQMAQHILFYGRVKSSAEIIAEIERVTRSDICRVAQKIFSSTQTLAAIGDVSRVPDKIN
jgi:predicted Zn-dependent peptidase